GLVFVSIGLVAKGTVVLAVQKPFGVEADDFITVIHVPQPLSRDIAAAAATEVFPILAAAIGELLVRVLPQKFSGGGLKAKQHAEVKLRRKAFEVSSRVV